MSLTRGVGGVWRRPGENATEPGGTVFRLALWDVADRCSGEGTPEGVGLTR